MFSVFVVHYVHTRYTILQEYATNMIIVKEFQAHPTHVWTSCRGVDIVGGSLPSSGIAHNVSPTVFLY